MSESFLSLVENSPDGIARFDLTGRFMYINAQVEQIMGQGREQLLGKTNHEAGVPHLLAARADRDIREVARSGKAITRTFSYPHGERFYEARLVPEYDDNGNVTSVLSISRDVSDRVAAADTLRGERDFAEELVNTVREPMLVLDSDYVVQSANTAFEKRFNVSSAEIAGEPLDEVVAGRFHADKLETLLSQILGEARQSFDGFDLTMNIPGRGRRTMRLNARQIDHLQLILLAMEDVTSQLEAIASLKDDIKQRNEELHAMTRRLRQLVVELSETEDRERQRLADLLHDDLQQMLAGVVFHIDLAESKCRGNREAVGLLANANTLLKDVITKARDVSHELSPAPFHTQGMEGGLTWLADQMYRQHGLDVDLRVNGNVDEMAASIQILVYKAIREMLFNIVKHAGVDHANVRIVREPAHVEVTVQDHGEGFDAEAVLDNKSQHGLGLFSIRERLDVLGGRLDVESTRGEGSRFRLMVPLVQKDIEDAAEQTRRRSDEADGQIPDHPPDQTISIVVVDDHEVVREGITRILQDRPEMVVLANVESGWQAIEVVNESEPDVVLMDYSMPDMDGIETTRRIAAEHPDVRIIGLSMYDEADIADQMLRAGASAFVEKTAPASQLLATIMAVNDGDSIASSTD